MLDITIRDGRTQFSPGERIGVGVQWQLDQRPDAVEIRLVWYTRGKGDTDVCIVDEHRFDSPRAIQTRDCDFRLPEAPYSFSGKLISLIWAVEVVVEPSNVSQRLEIVVSPDGHEVTL